MTTWGRPVWLVAWIGPQGQRGYDPTPRPFEAAERICDAMDRTTPGTQHFLIEPALIDSWWRKEPAHV